MMASRAEGSDEEIRARGPSRPGTVWTRYRIRRSVRGAAESTLAPANVPLDRRTLRRRGTPDRTARALRRRTRTGALRHRERAVAHRHSALCPLAPLLRRDRRELLRLRLERPLLLTSELGERLAPRLQHLHAPA